MGRWRRTHDHQPVCTPAAKEKKMKRNRKEAARASGPAVACVKRVCKGAAWAANIATTDGAALESAITLSKGAPN